MSEQPIDSTPPVEPQKMQLVSHDQWDAAMAQKNGTLGLQDPEARGPFTVHDIDNIDDLQEIVTGYALDGVEDDDEIMHRERHVRTRAWLGKEVLLGDEKIKGWVGDQSKGYAETQEELNVIWPEFKQEFTDAITKAIDSGIIPAHVKEKLGVVLGDTVQNVVDEAFIAHLMGGAGPTAFYSSEINNVGVSTAFAAMSKADQKHLLSHEYLHRLAGGTYYKDDEKAARVDRSRTGMGQVFKVEPDSLKYLRVGVNEAMTEHLALAIRTGDFLNINTAPRAEDLDRSYERERSILAEFVGYSNGIIKAETLIAAYFEDTGPGGSLQARKQLIREATAAYGPGAMRKLDAVMSSPIYAQKNYNVEVGAYFKPPRVDEKGAVIRRGDIAKPLSIDRVFSMTPLEVHRYYVEFQYQQTPASMAKNTRARN